MPRSFLGWMVEYASVDQGWVAFLLDVFIPDAWAVIPGDTVHRSSASVGQLTERPLETPPSSAPPSPGRVLSDPESPPCTESLGES